MFCRSERTLEFVIYISFLRSDLNLYRCPQGHNPQALQQKLYACCAIVYHLKLPNISFPKTLSGLYKIESLDGTNDKHWSQKLLLCFEQHEIDYVLITDVLDDSKTTTDADNGELSTPAVPKTLAILLGDTAKKKLDKDNKLARSYLLNNMFNPLFDLFVNFKICEDYMDQAGCEIWFRRHRKEKVCRWQVVAVADCRQQTDHGTSSHAD